MKKMGSTAKKILAPERSSSDYGAVWTFTGSDCCSGGFRETEMNTGEQWTGNRDPAGDR